MDALSKELTIDMLPDGLWRRIAEAIGIENFCKLADVIGGSTVYIPKLEGVLRPIRDAHIKDEFNGWNYMELARRYDLTERQVRQICGPGIVEGQIGLFDDSVS